MPFTPFHLGPALLFGVVLFRWLDLPTFLAANVVVDVRAALIYFEYFDGRLHGPLHTFVVGTALALVLSVSVYAAKPLCNRVLAPFRLEQDRAWRTVVAAALGGVYLHICLDSMLYTDIRPFYPSAFNPFSACSRRSRSTGCACSRSSSARSRTSADSPIRGSRSTRERASFEFELADERQFSNFG